MEKERLLTYAPKEFWIKGINEPCNGCGTDTSKSFVPNCIYRLDVKDVCCIHDYMYEQGKTKGDKVFSDVMFLYNLCAKILNKGGLLTVPRLFRATKYFVAVVKWGEKAFKKNKGHVPNWQLEHERGITFKGDFR